MRAPAIRKISETILDFGEPLISQLGPDQDQETVHATFEIVVTVWNCHVLATQRWGQPKFLADLQHRLKDSRMPPEMLDAHRALTLRRVEHFAKDLRAVGDWSVYLDDGRWRLRCDARAPPPL
jgi:hypothetical protein